MIANLLCYIQNLPYSREKQTDKIYIASKVTWVVFLYFELKRITYIFLDEESLRVLILTHNAFGLFNFHLIIGELIRDFTHPHWVKVFFFPFHSFSQLSKAQRTCSSVTVNFVTFTFYKNKIWFISSDIPKPCYQEHSPKKKETSIKPK